MRRSWGVLAVLEAKYPRHQLWIETQSARILSSASDALEDWSKFAKIMGGLQDSCMMSTQDEGVAERFNDGSKRYDITGQGKGTTREPSPLPQVGGGMSH